ncbi:hypothetical protein C5D47_06740 [Rathayibacter toxicus]|uniref:Uncharacterized protein n=1 Tax=Rathayibacter toxicus TaxID=145458 RepID=A0A2S5Y7J6_9MICO|nr:hypothetical protein C5D17_06685 [Rathayibacter toxicus]PPH57722.1 hypothetical protein C5D30_06695 [Rathayibacter toxicus]PPH60218.1 hypothetical protein C5C93_06735 [Rathayibacter toxicus]PPH87675.1 hypothetical protein C5D31_06735 [Rathayibacter toxicus]PPI15443.1 hypothetical protein C5C51_06680 [Rathayibacter toxicus]
MNAVVGHVMFLLRTVLWESALYRRYATQRELCATVAVKHTRPPMLLGLDRDAKTGATLRASTKHRRKLERASGRIRGAKQSAECDRLNCRAFSEGFLRSKSLFPSLRGCGRRVRILRSSLSKGVTSGPVLPHSVVIVGWRAHVCDLSASTTVHE